MGVNTNKFEKNPLAPFDSVAVSLLAKEAALNTSAVLSASFMLAQGSLPEIMPRKETNENQMTGSEEPTVVRHLGNLTEWALEDGELVPSVAALVLGGFLGSISTAAAGTGYEHTCTPIASMEPITFTAGYQEGQDNYKCLVSGLAVDSFTLNLERDAWAKLSAAIKGTGKFEYDLISEEVAGAINDTSITVGTAVLGNDPKYVHSVRTDNGSGYEYATVTAVTGTGITITPLSVVASTAITWEVLYRVTRSWSTLPAVVDELPLRTAGLTCVIDGEWNGSAFLGGMTLDKEFKSASVTGNNNLEVAYIPGGGNDYAGVILRGGRQLTVTLDRYFIDAIFQERATKAAEYMGLHLLLEGPEFDTGENFTVEIILPKVGLTEAKRGMDGKKKTESITLPVLADATYGSIIVKIKNEQATLLA